MSAAFNILAELVAGQLVQGEGAAEEGAACALARNKADVLASQGLGH